MVEDNRCPAIRLRGYEKGVSGKPNNNTQEAPNELNIQGNPESWLKTATITIANVAPNEANAICAMLKLG